MLKRLKRQAYRRLREEFHQSNPTSNCTCACTHCSDVEILYDDERRDCRESVRRERARYDDNAWYGDNEDLSLVGMCRWDLCYYVCCCCAPCAVSIATTQVCLGSSIDRRARQLAQAQLHQQEQLQADYTNALGSGEVLVAYGRVMMVGPGGVGKSSLLQGLMRLRLRCAESTILADTSKVKYQWAKTGAHSSSSWSEVTENDEIEEVATLCTSVIQHRPHQRRHGGGSGSPTVITTQPVASAVAVFSPESVTSDHFSTISSEYKKLITETEEYIVDTFLLPALRHVERGQVSTRQSEVEARLHVWDCGGQPVFLDVLPAFMTSRTLFMLFFNASNNLQGNCKNVINKQGHTVLSGERNITQLDLMLQWMASIHATLADKTTNGRIPKYPRIIPIGTHGDDPTVAGTKGEILADLSSHFKGKAFASLVWNGVVVDNTTAGQEMNEDPAYEYIRRQVCEYVKSSLTVRTPVAWVLFRKILQKIAEDSPVLSYGQAAVVGNICGIPPHAIPSVLIFYHELGVVLYYAFIESLNNHIIANPQWLIQQLGKLLALEGLECVPNQPMWSLLREKGILVQHLYELVWQNSEVKPEALVDLLEHFLLAAPINTQSQIHTFPGREYFVPCMLEFYSEDENSHQSEVIVKKASSLHLLFSTQYVPPGFFTRLATAMTKDPKCRLAFRRGIFRNRITVSYGEVAKIDEITITEHSSSIEIGVARITPRKVHHPTFQNACQEILKLIQSCSADVRHWLISIDVSTAFKCDYCSQTNALPLQFMPIPQSATTRSTLQCDQCGCHDATPKQQYWLKIHPLPQKRDELHNTELQGVAHDIMSSGKLNEIADALEVLPQLQSIENEPNPAFTLLQRWSCHGSQLRSTLVHYLRLIGLESAAYKVEYGEFQSAILPDRPVYDRPILSELKACARHINRNTQVLALALNIPQEKITDIINPFHSQQDQAIQILQYRRNESKSNLAEVLKQTGYQRAAKE